MVVITPPCHLSEVLEERLCYSRGVCVVDNATALSMCECDHKYVSSLYCESTILAEVGLFTLVPSLLFLLVLLGLFLLDAFELAIDVRIRRKFSFATPIIPGKITHLLVVSATFAVASNTVYTHITNTTPPPLTLISEASSVCFLVICCLLTSVQWIRNMVMARGDSKLMEVVQAIFYVEAISLTPVFAVTKLSPLWCSPDHPFCAFAPALGLVIVSLLMLSFIFGTSYFVFSLYRFVSRLARENEKSLLLSSLYQKTIFLLSFNLITLLMFLSNLFRVFFRMDTIADWAFYQFTDSLLIFAIGFLGLVNCNYLMLGLPNYPYILRDPEKWLSSEAASNLSELSDFDISKVTPRSSSYGGSSLTSSFSSLPSAVPHPTFPSASSTRASSVSDTSDLLDTQTGSSLKTPNTEEPTLEIRIGDD
eukprot:TRINITY_DN12184_c0_g1_i1.p1 TRINITY_DN12184_c0_g1~~TRINITY_DN12184_c0_g1_i1.p1  ORF type:complete len:433 (+),score=46.93 TRINITY_DN12184_c0_g1_i1:34-1299(+)